MPVVYLLGVAADYTCSEQKDNSKIFTHTKHYVSTDPQRHIYPKCSEYSSSLIMLKFPKPPSCFLYHWCWPWRSLNHSCLHNGLHTYFGLWFILVLFFLTIVGVIHNLKPPACWNYHIFNSYIATTYFSQPYTPLVIIRCMCETKTERREEYYDYDSESQIWS